MRMRPLLLTTALVVATPMGAGAQQPPSPPETPQVGSFDVGGRVSSADGDDARFQRYRDLRDGAFLENFRYSRDTTNWLFDAKLTHVGYRDQQYQASFNQFGKVKAWFEWNQVPLFYSLDTRTPYVEEAPGTLRIDDTVQRAGSLAVVAPNAFQFDARQRRDIAKFGLSATPAKNLDLSAAVSTTRRKGQMPWAATFGFSNAVEVAAPIDQRTTDLNAGAEWGNDRGSVRLQYDGSWFNNEVQTLVWDNPLRTVDSPTAGSSQGRMALWPNSTLNAVSVTGTARLPWRSRATAYVSVGSWNQDQELLPFTINSALPVIPLDRDTADASALVTALNFAFTSRPVNRVWFNVRYRRYDFDNRTPEFLVTDSVAYDQTLQPLLLEGTTAFGYVRHWLDADASYNLTPFVALRAGYGWEDVERTFRFAEHTTEHTVRASIDSTGNNYMSIRGVYEHGARTGRGFDEEALDEIGEQIALRQFDISDRNRDRLSVIAQVTPIAELGINGQVGVGRDERPDAYFGLKDAQTRFYTSDSTLRRAISYRVGSRGGSRSTRRFSGRDRRIRACSSTIRRVTGRRMLQIAWSTSTRT